MAGRRDGSEVLRAGELALTLISCSTWESIPYIFPWQQRRAGTGGIGTEEQAPKTREQDNYLAPCFFLQCWRAHYECEDRGELVDWPTLQPPRPRTRAVIWPTPTSTWSMICWITWRDRPANPKLQELHNTGPQWEPIIRDIVEARGLKPDQGQAGPELTMLPEIDSPDLRL